MNNNTIIGYRPDIDGLRALAVLSVVLFHGFPELVPGGFSGVDVFFVISGFLITGIIWRENDAGAFSFLSFYARRVRRIFPTLIVVLVACLVVGWWVLFDDEFKQLGNHTMRAGVFLSNFAFWREAGYFDAKAELKPLLHLWSLAIEEQFYILWPLVIWLVRRNTSRPINWLFSLLLVSFSWNIYQSLRDPVHDFYSPLTRFWELMAGGVLALVNISFPKGFSALHRRTCGYAGILLLLSGMWISGWAGVYPAAWALWPVVGAILFIASAGQAVWVHRFMTATFTLWVGQISYALYLWHWPVLSFLRILQGHTPSILVRLAGLMLSFLLAALSVRYIEKNFRSASVSSKKIKFLILAMIFVFVGGYNINRADGFKDRDLMDGRYVVHQGDLGHVVFLSELNKLHSYHLGLENGVNVDPKETVYCYRSKDNANVDIMLLGDSHAEHLLVGLVDSLPMKNVAFCGFRGLPLSTHHAFPHVVKALKNSRPGLIILLAAQWHSRLKEIPRGIDPVDALSESIRILQTTGGRVGLIDDIYQFDFDPQRCKYQRPFSGGSVCTADQRLADEQFYNYMSILNNVQNRIPEISFLKIRYGLCSEGNCSMLHDGVMAYRDSHHLNGNGSRYMAEILRPQIESVK